MAYMVPEVIRTSATAGERLLFRTLKAYLADDYVVYYEPEIEGSRPDFVIIGPDLGLVVLEVKDYTPSALFQIDHDEWQLYTSAGRLEAVENPYKQVRDIARHVVNHLKKDPQLIQQEGGLHGALKFPYGFGTVFTRMKQEDFDKYNLYDVISPQFVLCRDEMDPEDEGFSADLFIEKIHGMFATWSRSRYLLTQEDIQSIRYHLFPEARIGAEFRQHTNEQDQLLLSLHHIKAADLHPENMAKQLEVRHRLMLGNAASDKTVVLASRAKILAKQNPDWKMLVLSHSRSLSLSLRQMIDELMDEPEDLFDWMMLEEQKDNRIREHNVAVYHFHEWLAKVLNARETDIPGLIAKLEKKEAILPSYDAILIDKGQEFDTEWLRLLNHMLSPSIQNQAQDSRDRSRILSINYRNTAQIVQFAWSFYQHHSPLQNKVQEGSIDGVEIIPPQSTRRKGPEPAILRCGSFQEEIAAVVKRIQYLHDEKKVPYAEMVILHRVKNNYYLSYIDMIRKELERQGLPYIVLTVDTDSKQPSERASDAIQISTVEGARGLDFRAVFIVNTENMPFSLEEAEEREVSLFYMALTRALDWLFISYSGHSKFTLYLDEIQQKRKEKKHTVKKMG
ncbi:3'-5' exonuclease [Paenibacillus sp. LHD-38]|uniref:nuclease-related domain-containing DEAD/DEAH box helicase n=1 Tax=Paenibacillus sp. LHD-38 TaxID=3072143 RepID=UPI00280F0092|nr:3'-5' exonuclease [Paenibacillus sp. LHD-38]MDQ8738722.1 3'-5' exonuclease [Paenibacillus sp. LHD-38]